MRRGTLLLIGTAVVLTVLALAGVIVFVKRPEAPVAGMRLAVPVDCPPDEGCVVRNFVDEDPGPGAKDYRCGALTYDGHKGTDIRVPDGGVMARGVAVLAAAPGKVARLRDGMADVSIRVAGAAAVTDREAGNSVILDHGNGWETQYGHLRRGSIVVKPGDTVAVGQPIGLIGLSGNTEFTHVHFEVRHDGQPIDPFTGSAMERGCGGAGQPLWTDAALAQLGYREYDPFDAGFWPDRPDEWSARAGAYATARLTADSPALVFWIDVLGHRPGDRQTIRIIGPDGSALVERNDTVREPHVQWFQFIGKRRPDSGWAAGRYRGEYSLTRDAGGGPQTVIDIRRDIEIR